MNRRAVLFSEMTPDPAWEDDFNDWYDNEHIPARMRAPGFTGAQRYRNIDGPAYLAIYELSSKDALGTPEYQAIKASPGARSQRMLGSVKEFTRYIAEEAGTWPPAKESEVPPAGAEYVYAVFFTVPVERADEFERWYDEDHIPALLACPDWLSIRRFHIINGEPQNFTHLALHYLATPAALESKAREVARNSPWRARLAEESWFKGHYAVFKKIGTGFRPLNKFDPVEASDRK